ncbi:hypothetical protein ST47_g7175 [Ascochyta rabiei]|uniref:Uncharacterized protein n=1 Tax=Didymella rabiei TaxID=5454 RepID=A0A163BJG0_DIDRA|nr:hypothetical protein ST47_g7175 [Ascochyta rabiei]
MIFLSLLALFTGLACAQHARQTGPEIAAIRTYFYVGGDYSENSNRGYIFRDHMYVEKISPLAPKHDRASPTVLIHGQGQTGTNFLNKSDGEKSWTSHFLDAGHTIYIVDQTFRGQSAWAPRIGAQAPSTYPAKVIQQRFTSPERYDLWPQAKLHKQWPGTGTMGDLIFNTFYSNV